MERKDIQALAKRVGEQIQKVIVGGDETLEMMLCAMIARGHVLLEDVPGTGKTVMAKSLAKSLDMEFHRIHHTDNGVAQCAEMLYAQRVEGLFKIGEVGGDIRTFAAAVRLDAALAPVAVGVDIGLLLRQ